MPIEVDESQHIFHITTSHTSYAFQISKLGYAANLYWGAKVRSTALDRVLQFRGRGAVSPRPLPEDPKFSPDTLPQEYPGYGVGDFRAPAFQIQTKSGSTAAELAYRSYRIVEGKPALQGLPATYAEAPDEAQTLEIELHDAQTGLSVTLAYTVFPEFDVIVRSARLCNEGGEPVKLLRALSMSVDMPHDDFDLLHLSGAWLRERFIQRRPLVPGGSYIESRRGTSGHQHNPFVALLSKQADEDHGEVYGLNLVYSGSFLAQAEVDQFHSTRISIGVNPFDFSWQLDPGEAFQTPEVVMVYSDKGLSGMSAIYHRMYRSRLCRGAYRDKERPILVNNWEATYFDFDSEKLEHIASLGAELGMELFVLDDGWFGSRNDDRSSLGDWTVNAKKLPGGLSDLAERIGRMGMQFGLWFEPEMISPDSDLYRMHPDWCLHVPGRRRTLGRNQLVLDLSRPEVCDYMVETISAVLSSAPIRYVKWDMNRNMTEIGSAALPPERQRETAHRYMLGLYSMMERITSRFPDILFESCAGGGGRFDPGMLYYMPQTWTSDNSDAITRLQIQYGTSLVYPASAMGAHVSAVPNHQVGRMTPLQTRGHAAMSGVFGYELDLTLLSEEEREEIREQIIIYKNIRSIVQFGDFYRLISPFEDGGEAAWMFVSPDRSECVVFYFQVWADVQGPLKKLRLKGLDPGRDYQLAGEEKPYGGDHLMQVGVAIPVLKGDYQSVMLHFKATIG
ncbi:alpha-galactosidase [Paenibacillus sp. UNCCL117]|uniref:alpha-galactosidase n=1 Tax=unclassified Paenibacillus TaxID=185978 RepID=UPI0008888509|nr:MULTISPECIES: alpha-galactosidase [unclassified Paenibacillus]SDD04651.1 alpha-galactosidase [Paenibacillus sp. cl123]SFW32032.1 alpha-galactosidase [Paenibacillus sp. UNCCL117]